MDEIEIHRNSINEKDKVLVVDDLIATGGTAFASAKLLKKCKVKSIEFYFLIDLENVGGSRRLSRNYNVNSLISAKG